MSRGLGDRDARHVLQLGPLWVLSAITGTSSYFSALDREVFWSAVVEVTHRSPPEAREVLESITDAGNDLFLDFELDDRSVVAGLWDVVEVLRAVEADVAADVKLALLRIGVGIARARGPYGRTITPESEQQLRLLAELLELRPQPSEAA